jgi:hypothetical protein
MECFEKRILDHDTYELFLLAMKPCSRWLKDREERGFWNLYRRAKIAAKNRKVLRTMPSRERQPLPARASRVTGWCLRFLTGADHIEAPHDPCSRQAGLKYSSFNHQPFQRLIGLKKRDVYLFPALCNMFIHGLASLLPFPLVPFL